MKNYNIFQIIDNTDLNNLRFLACLSCGLSFKRRHKQPFCKKCFKKSIKGKELQRIKYHRSPEKHRNYTRKYRETWKYAVGILKKYPNSQKYAWAKPYLKQQEVK